VELTAEPINTTTYRDTTVTSGARYVYAVVAVDQATPPNRSELSNRVEESAR
jgi:fibronectin type 3 domain-containing protein